MTRRLAGQPAGSGAARAGMRAVSTGQCRGRPGRPRTGHRPRAGQRRTDQDRTERTHPAATVYVRPTLASRLGRPDASHDDRLGDRRRPRPNWAPVAPVSPTHVLSALTWAGAHKNTPAGAALSRTSGAGAARGPPVPRDDPLRIGRRFSAGRFPNYTGRLEMLV